MAIIKTLKESKIVSKGKPKQTIYPVTSSDAVIVPNKGKLTDALSKVAFSNDYNDLDNLPTSFNVEIPTNISAFNNDVGYLTSFTETDPTVPLWAKQNTKPSYNYSEILNTPILATVATSGSYNDLSNKPTIPTVPSNVSAFTNDAGYLTTETDPTVPSHVKGITQQNITNWNGKADVFTINCVYDGTSITSCDKTFAEISSAHNSGKILNVVINNGYAFGRLNQVASNAFYFNVVDTVDDHIIKSYELKISNNNTCNITLASIDLANYYTKTEVNNAIVDSNPVIEISPTSNIRIFSGTAPFDSLVDKQRATFIFRSVSTLEMSLKLTLSDGTETAAIPMYVITYTPANNQRNISKLTTSYITSGQHEEFMYDATNNRWVGGVIDSNTTYGALSQSELTTGTATSNRTITAKLLRDNFYLKSEIDATIGDIETLLASI